MAFVSRIYDAYGLRRFFPLKESEIDQAQPELRLHYLILYQKIQAVADWLKKYADFVVFKEPTSLLTPLHLCAMVGDSATAKTLLEQPKISVAEQDMRQWTPLHHSALKEDREMMDMLVEADKAKNCGAAALKNHNNGTYADLRRMAYPLNVLPNIDVFCYRNENGEIVKGNAAKFKEMTGAQFTQQMCASPAFFIGEWVTPTEVMKVDRDHTEALREDYQRYQEGESLVYLDKSKAGYGVFARQQIPEDTIFIDYLGQGIRTRNASLYAVELCDGANKRNVGAILNDGFPNCVDIPMGNVRGFPLIRVFRTTRPVERGEEFVWSYGLDHPVKEEIYFNLAGPRAEQWFLDKSLWNRLLEFVEIGQKIDEDQGNLRFKKHLTYFHYLLTTPSYQLVMLLKRVVEIDHLYTLVQQPHFIRREGELVRRKEIDMNLYVVKKIFDLCEKLGNPSKTERNLVNLVEELFAKFKTSRVVYFLRMAFYEEPYPPIVIEIMKGNDKHRGFVIEMVRDLEIKTN